MNLDSFLRQWDYLLSCKMRCFARERVGEAVTWLWRPPRLWGGRVLPPPSPHRVIVAWFFFFNCSRETASNDRRPLNSLWSKLDTCLRAHRSPRALGAKLYKYIGLRERAWQYWSDSSFLAQPHSSRRPTLGPPGQHSLPIQLLLTPMPKSPSPHFF